MTLTADRLLQGYANGIFPMAEGRDDPEVFWVDPRRRGVMPLRGFHASRSLRKHMRQASWHVSINAAFDAVIEGCADRVETWISDEIARLYHELHLIGHAHSVELWQGRSLIGGTYGVSLGAAWFGESMFSRAANASKTALAVCIDQLRRGGFQLFDTQFLTPHLASLGAIEISRSAYRRQLQAALEGNADFTAPDVPTLQEVVQRMTQTS
ncbi:MAG: leucyl/phenylalanyl-tRNA--protein transferase [Pseudomonadota bacterium]